MDNNNGNSFILLVLLLLEFNLPKMNHGNKMHFLKIQIQVNMKGKI